ncbi:MAG: HAMP domain-containing protein [Polyangiaceae bacterium]|nr:HAMP domain-containing protein [Polyangiaceae bacterium]
MAEAAAAPAQAGGRHQRRLRNYLLDTRFQLKYTSYLVAIAVVLSGSLGYILWKTSDAVLAQSHSTVHKSEQVVSFGKQVVDESRKVSAVVQMNIVKDEAYKDNPELLEAFKTDAQAQDDRLKKQQLELEGQAADLKKQSADIARQQKTMMTSLGAVLFLLVFGIGIAGILVTHKVAGPIFKMKRQIREVGEGKLKVPGKLRKGDELVDFFDAFNDMVVAWRQRQENEIALLDRAMGALEGKADAKDLETLKKLRAEMQQTLD